MLSQHYVIRLKGAEFAVTSLACSGLKADAGFLADFQLDGFEGDGDRCAQIMAEPAPFSCVGANAVIDVNSGEREWDLNRKRNQQVQQYNGVNAPAQRGNQMVTGQ